MERILITGTAGFIGFHLASLLCREGYTVKGFDGMTDYYDVSLKKHRHALLCQHKNFSSCEGMLEDNALLDQVADEFSPSVIVHLAAQAGVRYSLENPRAYIDSNVVGTFNVLEAARRNEVRHLMLASTSSAYGANEQMPFNEQDKADTQLTVYAATKKATENLGHAYSHLWGIPTTVFRFFTVYGPLGRPDLALYKFVDAILDDRPIDIYNNGDMYRDFTYVSDLALSVRKLMDVAPGDEPDGSGAASPVAPFRLVNIGNAEKVRLLDFIDAIEDSIGKRAQRNYLPMQKGDVPATWADTSLLKELTGFRPNTSYKTGVAEFVSWFREYYQR